MKKNMKMSSIIGTLVQHSLELGRKIFKNLGKDNIWKRMLKNILATMILVSIGLVPGVRNSIGKAAYLGAIITVFAHPGRRCGQMTEALILALGGTVLGVAWSVLGLFLSSLAVKSNPPAAYAIRAVFLLIVALVHGFLRSQAPRVFIFVLLLIIVSVVNLTSVSIKVTSSTATQILYPVLIAAGAILLVNLFVFPEFSSSFLGKSTIKTLDETASALRKAGDYFILIPELGTGRESGNEKYGVDSSRKENVSDIYEPTQPRKGSRILRCMKSPRKRTKILTEVSFKDESSSRRSLSTLTASKSDLRKGLAGCKSSQQECNFEVAFCVLPPQNMKPISGKAMKRLVANTIAVIGACESKYCLVGDVDQNDGTQSGSARPEPESSEQEPGIESCQLRNADTSQHPGPKINSSPHSSKANYKELQENTIANQEVKETDVIEPEIETESGNAGLLFLLLNQIKAPYENLNSTISRTIESIVACIAYAYHVPKLPSGVRVPKSIQIEELDLEIEALHQALLIFDNEAASAIEGAALMQEAEAQKSDIIVNDEMFLISSFLLNLRQAATHIQSMLKHSRSLVFEHQQRHGRRRVYAPRIQWSKWLYTGGEEEEAMSASSRKAIRQSKLDEHDDEGEDEESDTEISNSKESLLDSSKNKDLENMGDLQCDPAEIATTSQSAQKKNSRERERPSSKTISFWMHTRGRLADILEWVQQSDDVSYAFKLTVAVFLVLWPAFVASWNSWYSLNRGLWAALQLILITEVSIGTSVMTFLLRGIGTTLGCLWGWAAWEIYGGNRIVCAVIICIGLIPATYVQLGTKYPKAGMVSIVSICVVALATELETVPGTATENFLKRWIAFMIGGAVALIIEVVLLPVKARTRMVESLVTSLRQITKMENCIALGIEEGSNFDVFNSEVLARFEHASGKASNALGAAETFLPFCSTEPRIKGSFETLALIYKEMIFVLRQIVDRMENMIHLRTAYGSGPLEEFNSEIYPYRRNVAASINLTLFAIHGALITKLPLPQFLPSARLAYLRMIKHVKAVVAHHKIDPAPINDAPESSQESTDLARRQRTLAHRKYISWQAVSAASAEVIDYLEELIDLTKLLVGASEFRSGLLTRPNYAELMEMMARGPDGRAVDDLKSGVAGEKASGFERRRRNTAASGKEEDGVPASLRRIQSRKMDTGLRREGSGPRS